MTTDGWFWSEQDNESLKALRLTNMPNLQIAKEMGRTKKAVVAQVKRLGLPLRRYVKKKGDLPLISDTNKKEIRRRARCGETRRALALYYGVTRSSIDWVVNPARIRENRDRRMRFYETPAPAIPSVPYVHCLEGHEEPTFRMVRS
jgi:hypothetical protein